MNDAPSSLERAILELVAAEHWPSFRVDALRVTRREHTGVGRYTYFEDTGNAPLRDGPYGAGHRSVEMEGVPNGIFFDVEVSGGRVAYLELVTSGDDTWDGVERPWTIA